MSKKEKRSKVVEIAKDVLAHLRSMDVQSGNYIQGEIAPIPATDDAQQHIDTIQKSCKVCALGACFLSYVRLYDNVIMDCFREQRWGETDEAKNITEIEIDRETITEEMLSVFGREQMDLIEDFFECWSTGDDGFTDLAIAFERQYEEPKERLRLIMENIVANDGVFKPKLLPISDEKATNNE